jgi:hypothetical protein
VVVSGSQEVTVLKFVSGEWVVAMVWAKEEGREYEMRERRKALERILGDLSLRLGSNWCQEPWLHLPIIWGLREGAVHFGILVRGGAL